MSAERVTEAKPRSAERALLDWWRAVQFRDADTALRLTHSAAIRAFGGVQAFRAAVQDVGDGLPGVVVSESIKVKPGRTAVRGFIEYYDRRGKPASRLPRTFSMWRASRGWLLRDAIYLKDQAAAIRKARARAKR